MNTKTYGSRFKRTLPRWLGWGAVYGSVSLGCAVVFGINQTAALIAMGLGVVTWSVACALMMAREVWVERLESDARWRKALVSGLILRGVITVVVIPDFYAGCFSMNLVQNFLGLFPWEGGGQMRDFFCVYLVTLVQGAWVAGTLFGLTALARLAMRRDEKAFASGEGGADAGAL